MNYEFKNTKYFKYLSENLNIMEIERLEFNKEISQLLNSKTDEMGIILKCHLIIEYYLNEFLSVGYPTINHWERIRLSFNQKLELVKNPNTMLGMAYSSIKSLNSLRNKFSHRLGYKIKKEDFKEIKDLMTIWYNAEGEPVPAGIQLFQHYTIWICANLNIMIRGIKKQSPKIGLAGYLEWLENMTKNE